MLNHDKPPGYVFTEKDFLPKNTRAGLTAGVPLGRKLVTLDVSKIDGFFGLHMGDHVDLIATFQIEMPKGGGGHFASTLQVEAQFATMQKRARVRPLAQDAILVTAEHIREKPTISRSLSQGTRVRMIPVQEVDIAVKPEEVSMINEALATDVKITAVARSGQPGDDDSETPGSDPLGEYPVIDAIVGNNRDAVVLQPPTKRCRGRGRHRPCGIAAVVRRPAADSRALPSAAANCRPAATCPRSASHKDGMPCLLTAHPVDVSARSGNVLVIFGFLVFACMAIAAIVLDVGFARLTQHEMQTAADTAALEGLRYRDFLPAAWRPNGTTTPNLPAALVSQCGPQPSTTFNPTNPEWQEWCDCAGVRGQYDRQPDI